MNMFCHFLMGVLIQMWCYAWFGITPLAWLMIIVLGIGTHFIFDILSYLTWHPYSGHHDKYPNDRFFNIQQPMVGIFAAIVGVYYSLITPPKFDWFATLITPHSYFFAMFLAWLPDFIDWVVVRGLIKKKKLPQALWDDGIVHIYILKLKEGPFKWIPNWRDKRWAWINELLLCAIILIGIYTFGVP
jgi:hypothetical protein